MYDILVLLTRLLAHLGGTRGYNLCKMPEKRTRNGEEMTTQVVEALTTDGKKLRSFRLSRMMTRTRLASTAGMHPDHLGRLERDEITTPRIDTIVRLADALGVEPQELLRRG